MATCNSCGGAVNPGGRFCKHCGAPTVSPEPTQPVPQAAPQGSRLTTSAPVATDPVWPNHSATGSVDHSLTKPRPKPLWRNPVSLVVGGVVLIAIIGAVIVLTGSSSNGAQSTAAAAVADLQTGDWSKLCTLVEPSQQADCNEALKLQTASVSYPKVALATVSTNGDQATATISCAGATYCARFAGANSSAQLVRLNGTWYLAGDFSSSDSPGASGNSGAGTTTTTTGNSGNTGALGNSGNTGALGNSGNTGALGNSGNTGAIGNSGNS